jgi:hypothetical protein
MTLSRLLTSLTLTVLGLLLTLYGLLGLVYRGENGGNTYVMIGGHDVDAQLVGAFSLGVGLVALLCAGILIRRRPRRD